MADIQGGINFLCQRCQQPLKLSSTLYSLDEHTLAELSLPISPAHNIDIEPQVSETPTWLSVVRTSKQKLVTQFTRLFLIHSEKVILDGVYSIDRAGITPLYDYNTGSGLVESGVCRNRIIFECSEQILPLAAGGV